MKENRARHPFTTQVGRQVQKKGRQDRQFEYMFSAPKGGRRERAGWASMQCISS